MTELDKLLEQLGAVVTPTNRENHWRWEIGFIHDGKVNTYTGDVIWKATDVRTYGSCSTKEKAEQKATKALAKVRHRYAMLQRRGSVIR